MIGIGALAITLAGCSGPAASTGDPAGGSDGPTGTIAFSTVSTQIPLLNQLSDEAEQFLVGEGYGFVVQDSAFDPMKQAQQLQQAVDSGQIIGAWVFPVASEAIYPTIQGLQEKKIPVIVEAAPSDFGLDGPQPGVIFTASNFALYGETIAEKAAECVASHGGDGEAILVMAPETAGGAGVVKESIIAVYNEAAPDAQIVDEASVPDLTTAQTAISQLLIAHPNANVVIAGTDEGALGAVAAFKGAGRTPDCVVSGGGGPDALAAQAAGEITSIVAWDFAAEAVTAGGDLVRLVADPTAEGGVFSTPIKVVG